jgi:hypothetical protein
LDINKEDTQQSCYWRSLKPYQRIQLAFELHDVAYARIAGEIKRRHSDWTTEQVRDEVSRRFIR